MTDQEINVEVAEACGADEILTSPQMGATGYWPKVMRSTLERLGLVVTDSVERVGKVVCDIPNYCTDLNAMQVAIMALCPDTRSRFNHALMEMMRPQDPYVLDRTINATARQRAEALLRTLGKWKE